MLDSITFIPKARFLLLSVEAFEDAKDNFKLPNARKLIYELAKPWQVIFAYRAKEATKAERIIARCDSLGIQFWQTQFIDASWSKKQVEALVHSCDIVYAPALLKSLLVNSLLRQPVNVEQAIDAACYFSTSAEPFTAENFYAFLNVRTYGR